MASSEESVLLKSSVEHHSKSHLICLTASEIYWEVVSSSWTCKGPYSQPLVKTENQTVKLSEVIAVKPEKHQSGSHAHKDGQFQNLELVSMTAVGFSLHVIRRQQRHKWRDRKITFFCKDTIVCQQWLDTINEILRKPEFKRPKKLLVFVNPYAGKKKGPKIFREKVAPLFDLAGVSTEVVVTQRQNHARDMLLDYDLKCIDGVVCVGGDGMFSELLHGVMKRTHRLAGVDVITQDTELCRPDIKFGIIPAGSTDTLVSSIHGTNDVITATLQIILGNGVSVDITTVHHGSQFLKYQMSLLGYGYFGDVITDSEHNRWMGPSRYDWSGFKKVLAHRAYEGEISFIQNPSTEQHPRDGTRCKARCVVCQTPEPIEKVEETGHWQKIRGRFLAINAFTISCRCEKSQEGASPSSHLGDGFMDLVLVNDTSRIDYAKYLYRMTDKRADQFDFPFIQVYRVRRFKFQPAIDEAEEASDEVHYGQQRLSRRSTYNSTWNCDGELINEPAIDVRVHRKVIQVYGCGVEDEAKERTLCAQCNCLQC